LPFQNQENILNQSQTLWFFVLYSSFFNKYSGYNEYNQGFRLGMKLVSNGIEPQVNSTKLGQSARIV